MIRQKKLFIIDGDETTLPITAGKTGLPIRLVELVVRRHHLLFWNYHGLIALVPWAVLENLAESYRDCRAQVGRQDELPFIGVTWDQCEQLSLRVGRELKKA